ncbi:MAG: alpha/beta hydrolase, partial [Planctomycetes bacterium]|nr:alpha/beta hydrolase [Planctomycetota bacterium]
SYRRIAAWHVRHSPLLLPIAWWVPRLLIGNAYDPIDHVGRIAPRPLLIIHGTADEIVPVEMARRLHAAAGDPKELWLVDGADHYDPLRENADEGQGRLLEFFRRCVAGV